MDPASLAAALITASAGQTQQMVAAKMIKMNAEASRSVVTTLLGGAQQSLEQFAAAPAGMGANLDVRV